MKLYIIRHAPALERHLFAETNSDDSLRPLTDKGIERMSETLQVFKKNEESIDLVLQSPFSRCLQTGEILKEFYPDAQFTKTENLKRYWNIFNGTPRPLRSRRRKRHWTGMEMGLLTSKNSSREFPNICEFFFNPMNSSQPLSLYFLFFQME